MVHLAITYNVASIPKMGYKNNNNNCIFVKVRGAGDEDDDGEENTPVTQGIQAQAPQAQDPIAPSLMDIMGTLTLLSDKFERFQG